MIEKRSVIPTLRERERGSEREREGGREREGERETEGEREREREREGERDREREGERALAKTRGILLYCNELFNRAERYVQKHDRTLYQTVDGDQNREREETLGFTPTETI